MLLKNVRLVWTALDKPKVNRINGKDEYITTVIISKDNADAINAFNEAVRECAAEKDAKMLKGAKIPKLKDGDSSEDNAKGYPFLKNSYFYTLKNKHMPTLSKAAKYNGKIVKVSADEGDIYSGCYAYVAANPFFYSASGNKGVTFYLNEVIKVKDGDRLGAQDIHIDFDDVEFGTEPSTTQDDDWAEL